MFGSYTREYPERQMATDALNKPLFEGLDGAPHEGLYAAKICLGPESSTSMLVEKPPTVFIAVSPAPDMDNGRHFAKIADTESNILPRAFRIDRAECRSIRRTLLATSDWSVAISSMIISPRGPQLPTIVDVDADHLWFVYEGEGECVTDLGVFSYTKGDLVYIPSHCMHCFSSTSKIDTVMVGIESAVGFGKHKKSSGDNREVPYSDSSMRLPRPEKDSTSTTLESFVVHIRQNGRWSRVEYAYSPFLCVAWRGNRYPFAIHTGQCNFASVLSVHPDPSNFAVFAAHDNSAVVSILCPRFVHSLPYNHRNIWAEFLFYAKKYGARGEHENGVGTAGTATLHPQGLWHGPQIDALQKWTPPASPKDVPWRDELAIMFESRKPLELCHDAEPTLIMGYENSWLEGWKKYQELQETRK